MYGRWKLWKTPKKPAAPQQFSSNQRVINFNQTKKEMAHIWAAFEWYRGAIFFGDDISNESEKCKFSKSTQIAYSISFLFLLQPELLTTASDLMVSLCMCAWLYAASSQPPPTRLGDLIKIDYSSNETLWLDRPKTKMTCRAFCWVSFVNSAPAHWMIDGCLAMQHLNLL